MKTLLSSFTVKLFVWFWLIAITSIISTRFISQQLSNDSLSEVVTQEPKYDELEQLRKIARRIERSKIKSIGELFSTDKQKNFSRTPFNIWLKSIDNNTKVISLFPLPPELHQILSHFINNGLFTQPKTSLFAHTQLIEIGRAHV